jgi:hypothetical protein
MSITRFRESRPGPELAIETVVAERLPDLLGESSGGSVWRGASPAIGAGMPDLVFAWHGPEVWQLCGAHDTASALLGYLRSVTRARPETLSTRLGLPLGPVREALECLVQRLVVSEVLGCFALSAGWKNILPEIVAVEAKVSNWKKAVQQAARNRVFAHRCFVAVPATLAWRVCSDPWVKKLGIGVVSVTEAGDATIERKARYDEPLVWAYYYHVASLIVKESQDRVRCETRRRKEAVPGVLVRKRPDPKRAKGRVSRQG